MAFIVKTTLRMKGRQEVCLIQFATEVPSKLAQPFGSLLLAFM